MIFIFHLWLLFLSLPNYKDNYIRSCTGEGSSNNSYYAYYIAILILLLVASIAIISSIIFSIVRLVAVLIIPTIILFYSYNINNRFKFSIIFLLLVKIEDISYYSI